ncbi:MAG: hypothetical protein KDN20_10115 [Verrucomicrobiae bacterium]|nr:hypothetical protein [Verrucomicrobiae bacterium]
MKSDTPIDPSDPRISAFLLGELPADEALLFEVQLRRSPAAQAELEELREMSALLKDSFATELKEALETPSLKVLPTPQGGKVIEFQPDQVPVSRTSISRVAAYAALAAAVVAAAVVLPKGAPGDGQQMASVTSFMGESAKPVALVENAPPVPSKLPVSVPAFGYQGANDSISDGRQLVSMNPTMMGLGGATAPHSLGSDPTITEVRFLSDDPIDLQSAPLPAALYSYLPDSHGPGGRHLLGSSNGYLDTEKFPDPEIVHRRVELTGGVFQAEGARTRSLYRAEQRSDAAGRTSVILKGMVRLEAGEEVIDVDDQTDPSYEFEIVPVSHSQSSLQQEPILNLPSGARLRKAEVEADSDIALRYLVRQRDRLQRAEAVALAGRNLLEKGEYGSAVTNLELALQLLPEAPVTEEQRSQVLGWLEAANAGLADQTPAERH